MISLRKVCKEYGQEGASLRALVDVDLTINRGEYLAVLGPSGSGKTTLFNILGILEGASSGSYHFEGCDIGSLPDREKTRIRNKHFGYIFQGFNLFPELSALENAMLPLSFAGQPLRRRRQRAELLLGELGLSSCLGQLPGRMSGGAKQRVAIARALANDPDLILADEPTGELPSAEGEDIMRILESLNARGMTIVLVTHNPELGRRAKRLVPIRDGRLGELRA
jgi:putative ABC transport system ATP-binding protein